MRVLVSGAGGQLATELVKHAPREVQLHALTVDELDITDAAQSARVFERVRPSLVFNAAAFTAVDAAESDSNSAETLNHHAVALLARACDDHGARLVHVSTDYVFSGESRRAYLSSDHPDPRSVYGRTKRAGELAALESKDALVVRTAWLYSAHGSNFMKTMIRLMESRDEVRVVCDQVGSPTSASSLARALWRLARNGASGIHHWTDAGITSWFEFALAIRDEAARAGFRTHNARVVPIPTSEYPTAAMRPAFGILAKESTWQAHGGPASHWRENLRLVVQEYARVRASTEATLTANDQGTAHS